MTELHLAFAVSSESEAISEMSDNYLELVRTIVDTYFLVSSQGTDISPGGHAC